MTLTLIIKTISERVKDGLNILKTIKIIFKNYEEEEEELINRPTVLVVFAPYFCHKSRADGS